MFNVFENPWGLITAAVIALFVLLILRSISPEKCRWWLWLLPPLLVLAGVGCDFLVETDLEKIKAVINTGVQAVEDEDPDLIEQIIADDYSDSYHRTKSDLMSDCRATLSEPFVEKNIKTIVSIDVNPPDATAIFTVRILFDKQSYVFQSYKQQMLVKVEANLRKQPDGSWLISRVELLEIDFQPAKWKIIQHAGG